MQINRRTTLALLSGAFAAGVAGPVLASGTTVNASLWDVGDMAMDRLGMMEPIIMGMHGAGMMSEAPMGIKLDVSEVPAGEVTFVATNDSRVMIHEMVLAPVANFDTPLPYDTTTERVDEDAAGDLGEVAELDPGQSGALTVRLEPGSYILYCNIPGHYILGMWATLTVV